MSSDFKLLDSPLARGLSSDRLLRIHLIRYLVLSKPNRSAAKLIFCIDFLNSCIGGMLSSAM